MMFRRSLVIVHFFLCILLVSSCSEKSSTAAVAASAAVSSAASSIYPNGMAVSSLTAAQGNNLLLAKGKSLNRAFDSAFESDTSFEEKKEALDSVATATSASVCQVTLPNFTTSVNNPNCYGPNLDYTGHLDTNILGNENGSLPSGDLGLWTATESDGTACAAAKLNKDNQKIAAQTDLALMLSASVSCLINTDSSLTTPEVGEELDLTAALETALSENNTGTTVTSATLQRLSDLDSNPLYLYEFVIVKGSTTVTLSLKHNATNSTNTTYKGKIWGKFEGGMSGVGDSSAASLLYEKTDSLLSYKMLSTSYNSSSVSDPFTDNNDVDPTVNWSGNFTQTLINQDPETGLGFASYAWQAGRGDDSTRVFNIYTTTSEAKTVGVGFFGFGTKFNPSTGELSTNLITKFICNWAGPSNNHTGLSSKAQKQFIILSAGKFIPNSDIADPNLLDYAPVNSCDMTEGQLNSSSSNPFQYKLTSASYPSTQPAVSNELIDTTSDTEYLVFSNGAPVAPTDFDIE